MIWRRDGAALARLVAVEIYLLVLVSSYLLVIPGANYFVIPDGTLSWAGLVEAAVLLGLVLAATPAPEGRISRILLWLLLLLSLVPQLAVYAVRDDSRAFMWATCAFWAAVALALRYGPQFKLPQPDLLAGGIGARVAFGGYLVMATAALVAITVYAGPGVVQDFLHTGRNLSGAYDNRDAFVTSGIPFHGYYLHWLALVLNPAFFVLALQRRLWLPALAIVVFELMIASFVGVRSYFFALVFAGLVALIAPSRWMPVLAAAALVAVVAVGTLWYEVRHDPTPYLLFTARSLLDGGQISFAYYDFFSKRGPIPFAYVVNYFLHFPYPLPYPYKESPDYLVGDASLHVHYAAVTGVVADGYMNLSWFGMAIWAALLTGILKLFDACAERVNMRFVAGATAMLAFSLAGTYLVRVVFTSGLLWALLLLFLFSVSRRRQRAMSTATAPAVAHRPREDPV